MAIRLDGDGPRAPVAEHLAQQFQSLGEPGADDDAVRCGHHPASPGQILGQGSPEHLQTAIERVISLVLLGDLVSIYVAALRGVDPGPVAVLDELKAALASR